MARKLLLLGLIALWGCGVDRQTQEVVRSDEVGVSHPAGRRAAEGRDERTILFLGTSLTAGFGVDPDEAYPAVIAAKVDSAGYPFRVVNAGVSGETSAGGLRRIDWLLRQPVGVLVLELGANDGLRGLDPDAMRRNLEAIIGRTRAAHPDARIVVAGMEAPPNMGRRYARAFREVFATVAREQGVVLVPFLLDGVAGEPEFNQSDGIHPTAEGQRAIAETVWRVLAPVLREMAGG